jgi:hypothetical protein
MSTGDSREPVVGGMTVRLCFDLSRLYAREAEHAEDPAERERLAALSQTMENVGLSLIQWRTAHGK